MKEIIILIYENLANFESIYILLFGMIYLLFNEMEDKSVRHQWGNDYLNSNWKNKWALNENGELIEYDPKWYYFGFKPKYKEKFFLSSTVLVFLTDGEHLFQFFKNRTIEFTFAVLNWWFVLAIVLGHIIGSIIKEFLKLD